jgi:hypothetical protein
MLGRDFLPEESLPGRDHVVILRHKLWVRKFAVNGTLSNTRFASTISLTRWSAYCRPDSRRGRVNVHRLAQEGRHTRPLAKLSSPCRVRARERGCYRRCGAARCRRVRCFRARRPPIVSSISNEAGLLTADITRAHAACDAILYSFRPSAKYFVLSNPACLN